MEFQVQVQDIIVRARDVKSFRLSRSASFCCKAGQYVFVTLKLATGVRKPLSLSGSPTEKDFVEFTKKLTGHPFSNSLNALRVGDWAKIEGPYGLLTFEGQFEKIGLLSGGIGITPFRSICRYCMDMRLGTQITLVYGNRTEADIVFRDEFKQMQRGNVSLKVVLVLNEAGRNWKRYVGRIDAEMVRKEIPDYLNTVFYTCGPPGMVKAMDSICQSLGIPDENVRIENFVGYE